MTIKGSDFRKEVEALGFSCWEPRDKVLFCPSSGWLKDFSEYLLENRAPGLDEAWDCDDYALEAVAQASVACRESSKDTGHTFVYCTVRLWSELNGVMPKDDQIIGHACNLVRTESGAMVFFEPQNGRMTDAKVAIYDGFVSPGNALL